MDPVTLGLCSQIELDFEVNRAAKDKPPVEDHGQTLVPASVTTSPRAEPATTEDVFGKAKPAAPADEEDNFDADRVFSRLKDVDFGE